MDIKNLVAENAKAIAAFVMSALVTTLLKVHVDLPQDVQVSLQPLVVALIVYAVSNKPKK